MAANPSEASPLRGRARFPLLWCTSVLREMVDLLLMMIDAAFISVGRRTGARREYEFAAVILASPGGMNLGDQAMLESAVANLGGPVSVFLCDPHSYDIDQLGKPVDIGNWGSLLSDRTAKRFRQAYALGRRLPRDSTLFVIGADMMDGGYSPATSARIWQIAAAVRLSGARARILGFSWKGKVADRVRRAARIAIAIGVEVATRDVDSHNRFAGEIGSDALNASDIVFATPALSQANPISRTQSRPTRLNEDRPTALLNVSALISARYDYIEEHRRVVDALLTNGWEVVLLPHVWNPSSDDRVVVRALFESLESQDSVYLMSEALSVAEERALLSTVDLVVTGRMHLAVLSLLEGVVPIVISTQGKVSGLLKLFDLEDHCIDFSEGYGSRIASIVAGPRSALGDAQAKVRQRLPGVVAAAKLNFQGYERWGRS